MGRLLIFCENGESRQIDYFLGRGLQLQRIRCEAELSEATESDHGLVLLQYTLEHELPAGENLAFYEGSGGRPSTLKVGGGH